MQTCDFCKIEMHKLNFCSPNCRLKAWRAAKKHVKSIHAYVDKTVELGKKIISGERTTKDIERFEQHASKTFPLNPFTLCKKHKVYRYSCGCRN